MHYPTQINYQATYAAESCGGGNILITSEYRGLNGVVTISKETVSRVQKLAELQNLQAQLAAQKTDIESKIQFVQDLISATEAL